MVPQGATAHDKKPFKEERRIEKMRANLQSMSAASYCEVV
jgi:hypothetical protein